MPAPRESELQDAVSRSRNAQTDWNGLGIRKRIDILRQFQHLLQQNMTAIAQAITREVGKPYVEALLTEVMVSARCDTVPGRQQLFVPAR